MRTSSTLVNRITQYLDTVPLAESQASPNELLRFSRARILELQAQIQQALEERTLAVQLFEQLAKIGNGK